MKDKHESVTDKRLSRRDFLALGGLAGGDSGRLVHPGCATSGSSFLGTKKISGGRGCVEDRPYHRYACE